MPEVKGEEICNQRICTRTDRVVLRTFIASRGNNFDSDSFTQHSIPYHQLCVCSFLFTARRVVRRIESRDALYYGRKACCAPYVNTLASRMMFPPTNIRARALLKVAGLPKEIHNLCPQREAVALSVGGRLSNDTGCTHLQSQVAHSNERGLRAIDPLSSLPEYCEISAP